ncbi:MAG: response regulator transcription factor [Bacteroidetes bacterium]|nr:response regulator transcription factor [Bacteroidota bacterium]
MEPQINILLADDHQIIIDGINFMFKNEPTINIIGAFTNTNDVLNFLSTSNQKIDIVISDINMPTISGIELCRKIKEDHTGIRVLILSMYNSKEMVKEALLAEADGYVLKSDGKETLIKALTKINNNGTFFSEEIIPIIISQYKNHTHKETSIPLSRREEEVLNLIVNEYTSKEIAEKLFISKQTVDTHRLNIMSKTGCKSLVGLIKFAVKSGYIS